MLNPKLLHPLSIAIVGASDNIQTPGGKVLYNLVSHDFKGSLYGVNPKLTQVQGILCYQDVSQLPEVDMAIIAVAAKYCVDIVKTLTETKNTKAFIIFSAGFSEQDAVGKAMESEIVNLINKVDGTLLGPNNIGMFNTHFAGVFTTPIPALDPKGVDFISGSGATAVFIMEAAMRNGLTFNSVFSVGNSAQIGVEEVLQHLDETYIHGTSSPIKLLYIESIQQPQKLLKHARSLREKGAAIAAIKAGSSEAGSRAASSHTGAIANADTAVDALFQKAGIIRCHGRDELIHVAGVLTYPQLKGKNICIITHAGGPAVMLTDVLSKNGLEVPKITHPKTEELLTQLYPGSSVSNPIDFLATGTAQQLDTILTYCDKEFDVIDAMVVIFGSPGLFGVAEVYEVLEAQMKSSRKPIYPILPSVINVKEEIETFVSHGNFAFFDEVSFGNALAKVAHTNTIEIGVFHPNPEWQQALKKEIAGATGYLPPETINRLFQIMEIPIVPEQVLTLTSDLDCINISYPMVAKVIGPIHKTDVGGVRLNIADATALQSHFESLMQLKDATGVLIQPMLSGMEIYVGAKKEGAFGHTIVCGLGGIMIEVMKDVSMGLTPLAESEIESMIQKLKAYPILKGIRGKKGIPITQFANIILKVSELVQYLPEIEELDLNPLLATETEVVAVDARIRISNS
jgi:acetate---CoA ligase (ADP-forming)